MNRIVTGAALMPGFVLGSRLQEPLPSDLERWLDLPEIAVFEHQYGGTSCLRAELVGILFRLDRVASVLPVDEALIEAFRQMGESGSPGPELDRYPLISASRAALGGALTPPDLAEWRTFLSEYIPCPPFRCGSEALLESEPCATLEAFFGIPMTRFEFRRADPALVDASKVLDGRSVIAQTENAGPFGEASARALERLCAGLGAAPSMFFLWESSD